LSVRSYDGKNLRLNRLRTGLVRILQRTALSSIRSDVIDISCMDYCDLFVALLCTALSVRLCFACSCTVACDSHSMYLYPLHSLLSIECVCHFPPSCASECRLRAFAQLIVPEPEERRAKFGAKETPRAKHAPGSGIAALDCVLDNE
jgi:hypothetical protein